MTPDVSTSAVKRAAEAEFPLGHPYRLAVERMPESLPFEAYQAWLRVLIPLARIREDR